MPDTPLYCTQHQKDLIKREKLERHLKELAHLAAIIYAGYSKEQKATHDAVGAVRDAWCIIKAANEFGGM